MENYLSEAIADSTIKTYTNAVLDINFPDPTVIKSPDGLYNAYATNTYVNGKTIHIQIRKSVNLMNWQDAGTTARTSHWK